MTTLWLQVSRARTSAIKNRKFHVWPRHLKAIGGCLVLMGMLLVYRAMTEGKQDSEDVKVELQNSSLTSNVLPLVQDLYKPGFSIPNSEMCQSLKSHQKSALKLLIIVQSSPKSVVWRKAVRTTWGNITAIPGLRIAFLFGQTTDPGDQEILLDESEHYGDIIVANSKDGYYNLPLKTISMMEWVKDYCPQVPFILKADEDAFVNTWQVLKLANDHQNDSNTVFGRCKHSVQKVVRRKASKFYVPKEQYAPDYYPTFCTGLVYLMTQDVAPKLYYGSLDSVFLRFEDVLINGIVAEKVGVKRVHVPGVMTIHPELKLPSPCEMRGMLAHHCTSVKELNVLWSQLKKEDGAECK